MVRGNKFLAGLVAGAAVGAVASLLLAPKSGKETRQALRNKAGALGESPLGRMFGRRSHPEYAEASAPNGAATRRH